MHDRQERCRPVMDIYWSRWSVALSSNAATLYPPLFLPFYLYFLPSTSLKALPRTVHNVSVICNPSSRPR